VLDVGTSPLRFTSLVDDFHKPRPPKVRRPGSDASLSDSEIATLAIFSRRSRFTSERGFHGYAMNHLTYAFLTLPDHSQFNRLVRSRVGIIEVVALHPAKMMVPRMPLRSPRQRGDGRPATPQAPGRGMAGGLRRHRIVQASGMARGIQTAGRREPHGHHHGLRFPGPSTVGQPMAETSLAARGQRNPRLPSVGRVASGPYIADKGFEVTGNHRRWLERCGARIIRPPKRNSRKRSWPKRPRRWVASIRQIVETVYDKAP